MELRGSGLTASRLPRRVRRVRRLKRVRRKPPVCVFALITVFIILMAYVASRSAQPVERREAFITPTADCLSINITGVGVANGSLIVFFETLDWDLEHLRFVGMLVWTAEGSAFITSAFPNGTEISSGQSERNPFVFIGWTLTTSLRGVVTSVVYGGMHIVMDAWKSGRWSPSDGLLLKGNLTFVDATIYAAFRYDAIPEFHTPMVVLVILFVILLIARSHERLKY